MKAISGQNNHDSIGNRWEEKRQELDFEVWCQYNSISNVQWHLQGREPVLGRSLGGQVLGPFFNKDAPLNWSGVGLSLLSVKHRAEWLLKDEKEVESSSRPSEKHTYRRRRRLFSMRYQVDPTHPICVQWLEERSNPVQADRLSTIAVITLSETWSIAKMN